MTTGRTSAAALLVGIFLAGAAVAAIAGTALIVYLPYAAVGLILVLRRPANPIGWLLAVMAWVFALSWLPVDSGPDELVSLTAPAGVLAVAWFQWWWSLPLTLTLITALAVVFPTGRLPAGRWHRPAMLALGVMAGVTLIAAIWPAQTLEVDAEGGAVPTRMPNPLRLLPDDPVGPVADLLSNAVGPAMFGLFIAATLSILVRHHRARGLERLQLRWLVTALGCVVVAIPVGFVLFAVLGESAGGLVWLPATVAFALPPVAIGIAVLRYRLYEIDRIVSRTIGWAVVTGVLLGVFVALLVGLQALLAGFTQGETLAVAASTLVAFALFQPLRRRVQRVVDRRFDRARYDGERTATAFAGHLRREIDLGRLSAELTTTVDAAVRPAMTSVWIRGGLA